MKHPITVVVDIRAQVGEGPIWDANTNQLYWVDIMSGMLYCYNPISGKNLGYNVGQHVGTVVTRTSGGLLLATQNGFAAYDLLDQRLTAITDPESNIPNNRFNDHYNSFTYDIMKLYGCGRKIKFTLLTLLSVCIFIFCRCKYIKRFQ